jgi:hypothetical protein
MTKPLIFSCFSIYFGSVLYIYLRRFIIHSVQTVHFSQPVHPVLPFHLVSNPALPVFSFQAVHHVTLFHPVTHAPSIWSQFLVFFFFFNPDTQSSSSLQFPVLSYRPTPPPPFHHVHLVYLFYSVKLVSPVTVCQLNPHIPFISPHTLHSIHPVLPFHPVPHLPVPSNQSSLYSLASPSISYSPLSSLSI